MIRFLPVVLRWFVTLVLLLGRPVLAQIEEPMRHKITAPAGVDLTLEGTLTLPTNASVPAAGVPVVLLIAGSGPTDRDCNSHLGLKTDAFKILADSLSRQGVALLRYDKRYSGTNLMQAVMAAPVEKHQFSYYVEDAIGFIRQLQTDKRFSKVIVAGHSEGSLVGMLAARETQVAGFISIAGAGQNIAHVLKTQLANLPDTLRKQADRTLDSLRAGHFVRQISPLLYQLFSPQNQSTLISWMKYDPANEIRTFRGPVLLINGKRDVQVAVREAEALKAARPDARLLLFDAMTHVLKDAASDSPADQTKTYNDPMLPLTPGLATAIAQFVKQL